MQEQSQEMMQNLLGNPTVTIGAVTVGCVPDTETDAQNLGAGGFEPQTDLTLHITATDYATVTTSIGSKVTHSGASYRVLRIRRSEGVVSLDLTDPNKK